jgi:hypothetical protein
VPLAIDGAVTGPGHGRWMAVRSPTSVNLPCTAAAGCPQNDLRANCMDTNPLVAT